MSADRAESTLSGVGLASALNILEGKFNAISRLAYHQASEGKIKEAMEILVYAYEQVPILFGPVNLKGLDLHFLQYAVFDPDRKASFYLNAMQLSGLVKEVVNKLTDPGFTTHTGQMETSEDTDSEEEDGPDPLFPLPRPSQNDVAMTAIELASTLPGHFVPLAPFFTPRRHITREESVFIGRVSALELADVSLWDSQFFRSLEGRPMAEKKARFVNRIFFLRILGNVHTKHIIRSLRNFRQMLPNGARADTTLRRLAGRVEMYRRFKYQKTKNEDPTYTPPTPPYRPPSSARHPARCRARK